MVRLLGSTSSANDGAPSSLFKRFTATISLSDFPSPYIAAVLLPDSQRGPWTIIQGQRRDLPAPVWVTSVRAQGLGTTRGWETFSQVTNISMLPSGTTTPSAPRSYFTFAAQYLARTSPVNASPAQLPVRTHDSGSAWVATPLYCERLSLSVTHRFTPAHRGVKKLSRPNCPVKNGILITRFGHISAEV